MFFTNGGAEATENAMRMARLHTGRHKVLAAYRSYHGATAGAIAATGDDKANLVVSLLAKTEFAVPRVVARVNRAENEWLFTEQWGVDVAVSKPRLMAALVEEAVTVGDLVRLMTFRQGEANLVEITLPETAPLVGRPVRDGAAGRCRSSRPAISILFSACGIANQS